MWVLSISTFHSVVHCSVDKWQHYLIEGRLYDSIYLIPLLDNRSSERPNFTVSPVHCVLIRGNVIWWQVMIKGFCISKLHCIFTAMCTDKKRQHIYHMEGHSDSINHNFYGVGLSLWQNPVSLRVSDDRYIVLSFVLCGCIAGILLASVIIFLIRRNSRSKQKLAQLSSGPTGEGNEPSQDYQVNKIIIKIIISSLDNKVDWSFLSSDW